MCFRVETKNWNEIFPNTPKPPIPSLWVFWMQPNLLKHSQTPNPLTLGICTVSWTVFVYCDPWPSRGFYNSQKHEDRQGGNYPHMHSVFLDSPKTQRQAGGKFPPHAFVDFRLSKNTDSMWSLFHKNWNSQKKRQSFLMNIECFCLLLSSSLLKSLYSTLLYFSLL